MSHKHPRQTRFFDALEARMLMSGSPGFIVGFEANGSPLQDDGAGRADGLIVIADRGDGARDGADGVPDSIWIDIGYPVKTASDAGTNAPAAPPGVPTPYPNTGMTTTRPASSGETDAAVHAKGDFILTSVSHSAGDGDAEGGEPENAGVLVPLLPYIEQKDFTGDGQVTDDSASIFVEVETPIFERRD